jgi:hypothetical protein
MKLFNTFFSPQRKTVQVLEQTLFFFFFFLIMKCSFAHWLYGCQPTLSSFFLTYLQKSGQIQSQTAGWDIFTGLGSLKCVNDYVQIIPPLFWAHWMRTTPPLSACESVPTGVGVAVGILWGAHHAPFCLDCHSCLSFFPDFFIFLSIIISLFSSSFPFYFACFFY